MLADVKKAFAYVQLWMVTTNVVPDPFALHNNHVYLSEHVPLVHIIISHGHVLFTVTSHGCSNIRTAHICVHNSPHDKFEKTQIQSKHS